MAAWNNAGVHDDTLEEVCSARVSFLEGDAQSFAALFLLSRKLTDEGSTTDLTAATAVLLAHPWPRLSRNSRYGR